VSTSHQSSQTRAKFAIPGDLPADLSTILTELLDILRNADNSLDYFKKAGAWKDKPLTSKDPAAPIWVKVPIAIDFEDMADNNVAINPVACGKNSTAFVGLDS
jgi:hypothetical protein